MKLSQHVADALDEVAIAKKAIAEGALSDDQKRLWLDWLDELAEKTRDTADVFADYMDHEV